MHDQATPGHVKFWLNSHAKSFKGPKNGSSKVHQCAARGDNDEHGQSVIAERVRRKNEGIQWLDLYHVYTEYCKSIATEAYNKSK